MEKLGFTPERDSADRVYRFVRAQDHPSGTLKIDVLAPDHPARRRSLLTRLGRETITIDGGQQALDRIGVIGVVSADGDEVDVPVPDLLGAVVLKAAAWQADSRDRERHAEDAVFPHKPDCGPGSRRQCGSKVRTASGCEPSIPYSV